MTLTNLLSNRARSSVHSVLFAAVALFVPLLSTAAWSDPTLSGSTGLVEMATAETLAYKEWNLATSIHPGPTPTSSSTLKYKFNIAVFPNMELGVIGNSNQEGVFINTKVAFTGDNSKNPLRMALGIQNLSSFTQTNVYMVVSKRLTPEINAHIGFNTNLNRQLDPKFMAGTEVVVGKSASIVADISGAQDLWRCNAGATFSFTPQLSAGVYVLDLFNSAKDQNPRNVVGQICWTNFI